MDFRSRLINFGQDGMRSLSDKFIKDDQLRGLTNKIIDDAAFSWNDMNKNRMAQQSWNENNKAPADASMNQNTKKPGFFSRVGSFFKNLFNKNRDGIQNLVGKVPIFGGFANQMIDKFVPKQSALNVQQTPQIKQPPAREPGGGAVVV